jgi:hypothetical protein
MRGNKKMVSCGSGGGIVPSQPRYLEEKIMESCYEYLGCGEKGCIMYRREETRPCWEVEGTLCNHIGIRIMRERLAGEKEEACARSGCIYYKAAKERRAF